MTTARLLYNHHVIFTTSLYKSHADRTMTLRKSQGVGTPAVQLSRNYVHEFQTAIHVHFCIPFELCFKVISHKSFYEEASVLVEHGPKVWNSVIRLCIF